ncbi:optic atrophy 3 protein-domain-containing protein [Mycena rosella]|uniref:Optic atrophy 3 protein-domain-containing protein n=1 Tax=Mycena rosella TaxID=1033263 RepID=A0AAD7G5G9_MYCRO|nr:optic atrophy 3 protein-domain-containing protein [Mycena rosella]
MASVKIATLLIRTVAKPISAQLKNQAKQHERFRGLCVGLAQMMYRSEVKVRRNILGESPEKPIRPLSETRAIENGANALAEGFLFSVAAALILGEAWRSSRSQSKRRDVVDEQIEDLGAQVQELGATSRAIEERLRGMEERNEELMRIMERIVVFGLQGGWAEFEGTPLQLPRTQILPPPTRPRIDPGPESDSTSDTS